MRVKIYYSEIAPELEFTDFDLAATIKAKGECIIGRSPECDLVLDGLDLSRQHGKFLIKDEYYYFCDLGSRNGSLLNSELVERDREYLLNLGDTIRIGDFVLKMEPEEELAATVFKVIDPALFKSRQQQVENVAKTEDVVSPILPIDDFADEAISYPIIVDRSAEYMPIQVIEEQPASALVVNEIDEEDAADEISEQPESSLVVEEANPLDRVLEEHPLAALVNDEVEEATPDPIEDQSASALVIDEIGEKNIPEEIEEQPTSILVTDEENLLDLTMVESQPISVLIVDEIDEIDPSEQTEEEHLPSSVCSVVDKENSLDRVLEEHPLSALVNDNIDEEEIPDEVEEHPESIRVIDEDEIVADFSDQLVVENLPEETNPQVEIDSSTAPIAPVAAVVAGFSATSKIGAELLAQKQIVLIAHDDKIADLTDLVDQHKDFLAKCRTISWSSVAESLRQQTGMIVSKEIPNGSAGGYQTIAGLVNSGDVLAVIFLRDFFGQQQTGQANEEAILRLCNINEILLATNIATAEAIVHYLQS